MKKSIDLLLVFSLFNIQICIAQEPLKILKPECIAVSDELENTKQPETIIESLTEKLDDQELFTRLVFSEALATSPECIDGPEQDAIIEGIARVVMNRVQANKDSYGKGRGVVTKPYQFRSSLGGYDIAKKGREEFLCPTVLPIYTETDKVKFPKSDRNKLWEKAIYHVQKAQTQGPHPLDEVYNYYLGEHFMHSSLKEKWHVNTIDEVPSKVSWAQAEKRVTPKIEGLNPNSKCILFYKSV